MLDYHVINEILGRNEMKKQISSILTSFDSNANNLQFKKGIFIFGAAGTGKTLFVKQILETINYDMVRYDAGDIRNKSMIDTITNSNMTKCNVFKLLSGIQTRIAIVMDEIDGMTNGDKGGISSLTKLIRQKRTKKQKMEQKTDNPVICIGNYIMDKKIRELMKVCNAFELKTPTDNQIRTIISRFHSELSADIREKCVHYIQGDLRKLDFIDKIYDTNRDMFQNPTFYRMLCPKMYNQDSKTITRLLLSKPYDISKHDKILNETDRTIVSLLWHENIPDIIQKFPQERVLPFYTEMLSNFCYADYIDRITFQNQIWQFNEMSSLMKTFRGNKLLHSQFNVKKIPDEVRFTKILTKYSTEYNNTLFIFDMCQKLSMDKQDLISMFREYRTLHGFNETSSAFNTQCEQELMDCDVSKLDIKRIYRYLDKNVKKDAVCESDAEDDD